MAATDQSPVYSIAKKRRAARKYIKLVQPHLKARIRSAIRKICQNPKMDGKKFAISRLEGSLRGYYEYRLPKVARIIYRIIDETQRHLEIHEVLPHL